MLFYNEQFFMDFQYFMRIRQNSLNLFLRKTYHGKYAQIIVSFSLIIITDITWVILVVDTEINNYVVHYRNYLFCGVASFVVV